MTPPCTLSGIRRSVLALPLIVTAIACGNQQQATPPATTATPPSATPAAATGGPTASDAPIPDTPSPFAALPETVRATLDKPFTGDLDEMVKRRLIRVGVTFNRTHYFIDRGQERGITYEALKAFESDLEH